MIEHESHAHAHRTGLPWLDLIIAGSAIFISIISLIVSIQHGRTMEKLVAANEKQVEASTLPILHFDTSNALSMLENEKIIHFDVSNGGTGPASIEWFRIKWNGQPVNGWEDLLGRCCGGMEPRAHSVAHSTASGLTLPAGRSLTTFLMRATDAGPALYQLINEARHKMEPEACYCSVLDQCWITDFKSRPRMVKACEPIPDNQRW